MNIRSYILIIILGCLNNFVKSWDLFYPACETCCSCVSSYYYPVCASNGKRYNNVCDFNCARSYYLYYQGVVLTLTTIPCYVSDQLNYLSQQPTNNQYSFYPQTDNWYQNNVKVFFNYTYEYNTGNNDKKDKDKEKDNVTTSKKPTTNKNEDDESETEESTESDSNEDSNTSETTETTKTTATTEKSKTETTTEKKKKTKSSEESETEHESNETPKTASKESTPTTQGGTSQISSTTSTTKITGADTSSISTSQATTNTTETTTEKGANTSSTSTSQSPKNTTETTTEKKGARKRFFVDTRFKSSSENSQTITNEYIDSFEDSRIAKKTKKKHKKNETCEHDNELTKALAFAFNQLKKIKEGRKQKIKHIPKCETCCNCAKSKLPVCASNGKTYDNMCLFMCASAYLASRKREYIAITEVPCKPKESKKGKRKNLDDENNCSNCPTEIKEVCASNGETYKNKCFFNCAKKYLLKIKNEDIHIIKNESCPIQTSVEEVGCICPAIIKPVCASNGKKYANLCAYECAKQKLKKQGKVLKKISCKSINTTEDLHCVCPREYFPVCASNGKIYPNECFFDCHQRYLNITKGIIIKVDKAPCYDEAQKDKNKEKVIARLFSGRRMNDDNKDVPSCDSCCECPSEIKPVCAQDGSSYPNQCLFDCAKRFFATKGHEVKEASCPIKTRFISGRIINDDEHIPSCESCCECPTEIKPVCAEDAAFYPNKCLFDCAKKFFASKGHEIKEGKCPKESNITKPQTRGVQGCNCPFIDQPVCGSNGKFYTNECLFRCDQKKKAKQGEPLTIINNQFCKREQIKYNKLKPDQWIYLQPIKNTCKCPRNKKPVCDQNGKVYNNKCIFNCQKNTKRNLILTKCPSELKIFRRIGGSKRRHELVASCNCPKIYYPICASNGKTYFNECQFECARKVALETNGTTIKIKRIPCFIKRKDGYTDLSLEWIHRCTCPEIYAPICASNGRRYLNDCNFECARKHLAKSTGIVITRIKYPCYPEQEKNKTMSSKTKPTIQEVVSNLKEIEEHSNEVSEELSESESKRNSTNCPDCCKCSSKYYPVCASDNFVYPNECAFECSKNYYSKLGKNIIIKKVPCYENDTIDTTFPITTSIPVSNRFETSFKLSQTEPVITTTMKVPDECEINCEKIEIPVCATNSKIYPNQCVYNCAKKYLLSKGIVIAIKKLPCYPNTTLSPITTEAVKIRKTSQTTTKITKPTKLEVAPRIGENPSKCGQFCTTLKFPVCASDGMIYRNPCVFKCVRKRKEKEGIKLNIVRVPCFPQNITEFSKKKTKPRGGRNKKLRKRIPDCEDCCPCPMIYLPICASNGKKYHNGCSFECAKKYLKSLGKNIKIINCPSEKETSTKRINEHRSTPAKKTPCKRKKLKKLKSAVRSTFDDNHEIERSTKATTKIKVAKINPNPSCEECCECPNIHYPVCASNGKIYKNDCFFECAKHYFIHRNKKVIARLAMPCFSGKPKSSKPYDENRKQEIIDEIKDSNKKPICKCPKSDVPVCASNGLMYSSICEFECEQKYIRRVSGKRIKITQIPCFSPKVKGDKPICSCPKVPALSSIPVCASNGVRYPSICNFECDRRYFERKGKHIEVVKVPCYSKKFKNKNTTPTPELFEADDVLYRPNSKEKHHSIEFSEDFTTFPLDSLPTLPHKRPTPFGSSEEKNNSSEILLEKNKMNEPNDFEEIDTNEQIDCNKCSKVYLPLCASNGKRYSNPCFFECHKKLWKVQGMHIKIIKFPCYPEKENDYASNGETQKESDEKPFKPEPSTPSETKPSQKTLKEELNKLSKDNLIKIIEKLTNLTNDSFPKSENMKKLSKPKFTQIKLEDELKILDKNELVGLIIKKLASTNTTKDSSCEDCCQCPKKSLFNQETCASNGVKYPTDCAFQCAKNYFKKYNIILKITPCTRQHRRRKTKRNKGRRGKKLKKPQDLNNENKEQNHIKKHEKTSTTSFHSTTDATISTKIRNGFFEANVLNHPNSKDKHHSMELEDVTMHPNNFPTLPQKIPSPHVSSEEKNDYDMISEMKPSQIGVIDTNKEITDCKKCSKVYLPLCASNGKRYLNPCYFECDKKLWKAQGMNIKIIKFPCYPEKDEGNIKDESNENPSTMNLEEELNRLKQEDFIKLIEKLAKVAKEIYPKKSEEIITSKPKSSKMKSKDETTDKTINTINNPYCEDCCQCPRKTSFDKEICASNGIRYHSECDFECAKNYFDKRNIYLKKINCTNEHRKRSNKDGRSGKKLKKIKDDHDKPKHKYKPDSDQHSDADVLIGFADNDLPGKIWL